MPVKIEVPSWETTNSFDKIEWEDDMNWDIKMMELPTSEFMTSAADCEFYSTGDFVFDAPASPKHQIRHHDCMWSGTCVDQSHPGKFLVNGALPETTTATVTAPAAAAAAAATSTTSTTKTITSLPQTINNKSGSSILTTNITTININNNIQQKLNTVSNTIKAGSSLLINPRNKQQINKVPTLSTTDFLKEREHIATIARPDTPLSLDDDPPEFKHNIDLATCTVGSNKMSLVSAEEASSIRIINMLKEHLEETSNDTSFVHSTKISADIRSYMSSTTNAGSLTDLLKDLKYLSDYEEIEDDDSHSDNESDDDSSSSSSCKRRKESPAYEYQGTHVGDHSYTRPKNRYNPTELGVQTPSDSEEEIDVVSIGDKNLPTNPTARDRRALQTTVAHKIRKGARTIPQRRRCSDDEFTIAAASNTASPSKSFTSNHFAPSPNYATPSSSTSISGTNTPLPLASTSSSSTSSSSRKRPHKSDANERSSHNHNNSKRHRGKKQRISGKKAISDDSEEADTLEKRNLHNDMERQRRIGLKNLFEELKRQIPNIRDKERAPKVNILREAAALCNRLNREQEQLNALKKQQSRLYARVRQLRTSLHSQRRLVD